MRTSKDEDLSEVVLIDLGVSANLKVTPVLDEAVGTLTTMAPELFFGNYDECLESQMELEKTAGSTVKVFRVQHNNILLYICMYSIFILYALCMIDTSSRKCDIWSIGMTLYMCAVCMEPWNKGADNMTEDEMQECRALS